MKQKLQNYRTYIANLLLNKNYRKNLIVFLLVTSLPGIIFTFVLFIVSKTQMENELHEVHKNYLHKTIETIDEHLTNIELLLGHWASDSNFMNTYNSVDVVTEYESVYRIYNTLLVMEGSNPLIGRVELFINEPKPLVFTKNGYYHLTTDEQKEHYESLLHEYDRNLFWTSDLTPIETGYENRYAPIKLVHKITTFNSPDSASIIVFLNKEALLELIKSPYEEGSVFIQRNETDWIFTEDGRSHLTALENEVLTEIGQNISLNEPFVFEWEGLRYTVTYDTISRLQEDWKYISVAPLSTITEPVVFISKLFLIISLSMLLIAIILTIFVSNKLYAPVKKLLEKMNRNRDRKTISEFEIIEEAWEDLSTESEQLQKKIKRQLPYLRQGFLLQLIQGFFYSYPERILIERMEHFGWTVKNHRYILMYIQLFGFSKVKDKFGEDEGLITFVASNITEELMQNASIQADVINFHDLSLGVFITYDDSKSHNELKKELVEKSEEMITYINQICKMDVSVGISRRTDSIKLIHNHFEETKNALSFRNVHENNQIIEIENMDYLTKKSETLEYPFDIEKQMSQAIRLRDKEETKRLLQAFFQSITSNYTNEALFKQTAFQLLGSILQVAMQSGLMNDFVDKGANLYQQLNAIKDMEEINRWFEVKVIDPMIDELSQKKNQRLQIIVEKVIELLEENYMNDISLDECAEQVKLNPSILSKVFKDITGLNFIDYLTNIRLNKAKEMLIDTDLKINQVAQNIGYRHSYFNRLFKKSEGVTPSEFRSLHR
ncbi:helix-turn-helix domain-containing protein [Gracilibacillus salitolerans]|uniref:Helix-turn-helix domain-containing protein n=1 Tax=Gracilibacillus salitolerans TaxID=2663022 RepID=A0A5Q2TT50_9BACI|nr:helix-turn-helix domain-containing protein [Gracilibacillus salitolerans]QGH35968.1 helix-turn-helix domain-containing protein [Gracilibacillus salitolerans]